MSWYLFVKALHIIFIVAWMAGMLIFPRYKIHQLSSQPGEPLFDTMKEASIRLRKVILTPSMGLVWILGLTMITLNPALLSQGWFHAKLFLVLVLSGLHGFMIGLGRKVDNADSTLSTRRLKILNELPFVLMIFIVLLVVLKPF